MFSVQSRRVCRLMIFFSLIASTFMGCDLGTYASRSSENGGAAQPAGGDTQTPAAAEDKDDQGE